MVVCIYYSGWGLFWGFLFCFFNSEPLPSPAGFWGWGGGSSRLVLDVYVYLAFLFLIFTALKGAHSHQT